MKCLLIITMQLLVFVVPIIAQNRVIVKSEHIRSGWNFTQIDRPSRSDIAKNATIKLYGNEPIASCLSTEGLHNGVLPQECRLLRDFFCFTNANADGGQIVMDLGAIIPIAQVNSYSAHGPVGGTTWCEEFDGSRAPQVYTLYASLLPSPDASDPSHWTKITDVDTRPKEGDWVGQYGVNIVPVDNDLIGEYRWLMWDIKSTFKVGADNPKWTDTWYTELDVHTPNTLQTKGDAIAAGSNLEEIIVVYKSHFDIGFTHPAPEIVNVYRAEMIDQALKTIDDSKHLPKEKQFSWTIPSWVAYQILWEGQSADRRERILSAIRSGRLVVHGLPITMHTESLELEDVVMALQLNRKLSEEVGIPMSRSGKMTDVPSHSWILPTLLKNAGMDFMHIGVNPVNERPNVPMLYYWEGPDKSQILTMHPQGYGSDPEFGHGLFPPKDWPYKHWLAMIVATDNAGPPSSKEIEALLKQAEETMPGVKVRFGTMEDFADAIVDEEKNGAHVPVVRADMPDCWIHGTGTMPEKTQLAMHTRVDLTAVKILDGSLDLWGVTRPDIRQELWSASERSLMYGEHTWGGNRNLEGKKVYGMPDFKSFIETDKNALFLQNTWNDHAAYIDSAKVITDLLLNNAMLQLANAVDFDGDRFVVWNPLPWMRSAVVNVEGQLFEVKDIPACGYKTYRLNDLKYRKEKPVGSDQVVIENKQLKLTIDRLRGGITSAVNKSDGRELIDDTTPYAFGQYLYERFDSAQVKDYHLGCSHLNTVYGYNGRGCKGWNVRADIPATPAYQRAVASYEKMYVRENTFGWEVVLEAQPSSLIRSKVTITIALPKNAAWFDVKVALDDKEPDYWPEAGAIYLPVKANNPQFRLGRLGGVVDPVHDFAPGANRTYGIINTGAIIADGTNNKGLAIVPLDHGMMSFGEKGICMIDPDYVPTTPVAYASMFNTVWTINFPYWIQNHVESTVRIWATDNVNAESLITQSLEARNPMKVAVCKGGSRGELPKSGLGISLSRKGIKLSTLERVENNERLLQLWECEGRSGALTVTFPKKSRFTSAIPVDLRGQIIGEPIAINKGVLKFDIRAYAPVSFILK